MSEYKATDFVFQPAHRDKLKLKDRIKMCRQAMPDAPKSLIKEIANLQHEEERLEECFLSPMFQVLKRQLLPHEHGFGPNVPTYLSIKRRDKQAFHAWRAMQKIKNALCGPDWEGVEIYPQEDRLVDTCNQYHLFCFKGVFPIYLFNKRAVFSEEEAEAHNQQMGLRSVQRDL